MNNHIMKKEGCVAPISSPNINAVLRFMDGDERFQLKITVPSGRTFNFDRASHESLQLFRDRMTTNISKKWKNFAGHVSFHMSSNKSDQSKNETDLPMTELDYSLPTVAALHSCINGDTIFMIQIDQDLYPVVPNPPEIFGLKLLSKVILYKLTLLDKYR